MAPAGRIIVKGQRELNSSFRRYERRVKYGLAKTLLAAAEIVAGQARGLFTRYDARSAGGFRPRVRRGALVVVEQRYRRTTGQHPYFGVLQMQRALLPAMVRNEAAVIRAVDHLLDRSASEAGF